MTIDSNKSVTVICDRSVTIQVEVNLHVGNIITSVNNLKSVALKVGLDSKNALLECPDSETRGFEEFETVGKKYDMNLL